MNGFCGNEEIFAAYIDGRLSGEERLRFEEHLSKCSRCLAELVAVTSDLHELAAEGEVQDLKPLGRPFQRPAVRPRASRASRAVRAAAAVAAASILIWATVNFLDSPRLDRDFRTGREQLRELLSSSELGELRLTNGREFPVVAGRSLRGTDTSCEQLAMEAEKSLKRALERNRDDSGINTLLGHLYMVRGEIDRAEVFYRSAGQNAKTLNNLAVVAYRRSDLETSLRYLDEVSRADDAPPEAFYNLAVIHHELSHTEETKRFVELYLGIDSDSPWAEKARSLLKR